jgi:hypothetical protein
VAADEESGKSFRIREGFRDRFLSYLSEAFEERNQQAPQFLSMESIMARQDKSLKLSLENLEGRNLTTSLGAASVAAVAIAQPPAQVSTVLAQHTLATHNYALQTGFFMR